MIIGIVASQITEQQQTGTSWSYVGTAGGYDASVTLDIRDRFGNPISTCYTSTQIIPVLNQQYPASNYQVGFRIRAVHIANNNGVPIACQTHIYVAV